MWASPAVNVRGSDRRAGDCGWRPPGPCFTRRLRPCVPGNQDWGAEGRDGGRGELSLPLPLQSRLAHPVVTLSFALNMKVLSKLSLGSWSANPNVSMVRVWGGEEQGETGPAPPGERKPRPARARSPGSLGHQLARKVPLARRGPGGPSPSVRVALGRGGPARRPRADRDSRLAGGFSAFHYALGLSRRSQMTAHVSPQDRV